MYQSLSIIDLATITCPSPHLSNTAFIESHILYPLKRPSSLCPSSPHRTMRHHAHYHHPPTCPRSCATEGTNPVHGLRDFVTRPPQPVHNHTCAKLPPQTSAAKDASTASTATPTPYHVLFFLTPIALINTNATKHQPKSDTTGDGLHQPSKCIQPIPSATTMCQPQLLPSAPSAATICTHESTCVLHTQRPQFKSSSDRRTCTSVFPHSFNNSNSVSHESPNMQNCGRTRLVGVSENKALLRIRP